MPFALLHLLWRSRRAPAYRERWGIMGSLRRDLRALGSRSGFHYYPA